MDQHDPFRSACCFDVDVLACVDAGDESRSALRSSVARFLVFGRQRFYPKVAAEHHLDVVVARAVQDRVSMGGILDQLASLVEMVLVDDFEWARQITCPTVEGDA